MKTDIERLSTAMRSLVGNDKIWVGVLCSVNLEYAKTVRKNPELYLIKGKVSLGGWPFSLIETQGVLIEDIDYPKEIGEKSITTESLLLYHGEIIELWELDNDFNPTQQVFHRTIQEK